MKVNFKDFKKERLTIDVEPEETVSHLIFLGMNALCKICLNCQIVNYLLFFLIFIYLLFFLVFCTKTGWQELITNGKI